MPGAALHSFSVSSSLPEASIKSWGQDWVSPPHRQVIWIGRTPVLVAGIDNLLEMIFSSQLGYLFSHFYPIFSKSNGGVFNILNMFLWSGKCTWPLSLHLCFDEILAYGCRKINHATTKRTLLRKSTVKRIIVQGHQPSQTFLFFLLSFLWQEELRETTRSWLPGQWVRCWEGGICINYRAFLAPGLCPFCMQMLG